MNDKIFFGAALSSLLLVLGCEVSDPVDPPATTGVGGDDTSSVGGQGGTTSSTGGQGGAGVGGGTASTAGYVFTMSNDSAQNEVIVFERGDDGALLERESLPTGGLGSGDGLGSQGALTLSPSGDYLYVVNAGSDQLSSFRIYDDHLALVDLVDSGGVRPISVTASEDHLYVVNAGGDGGVQGFSTEGGMLTPIEAASQPLSAAGTAPAQVMLSPDGTALIVTEKATDSLLTYWVAPDGSLSALTTTASEGVTPFGFDFAPDGTLLVSEAFGGNEGESAVSSYSLGSVEPQVISSSVPSGQSAACWLLVARGQFAYTTNTASNNISGYDLASDGTLTLFSDNGETASVGTDSAPIDMALSSDDEYLYVLNAQSDLLVGFVIEGDGSLSSLSDDHMVPETSVGLVAR